MQAGDPHAAFLVPADGLALGRQLDQLLLQGRGALAGKGLQLAVAGARAAAEAQGRPGEVEAGVGRDVFGGGQFGQTGQQVELVLEIRVLAAQQGRQGADDGAAGHGAQGRVGA